MEYRKVGSSGLKVSAISLGAWLTYGSSTLQEETAIQCIRRAIAWTLHNPLVASAITGATKPLQVDENLKALDVKITPEIITKIESILQKKRRQKLYRLNIS